MTEWIPAGLEPGSVGERVYASTSPAEARAAIGAAAGDDARLAGAAQAGANLADLSDPAAALARLKGARMVGLFAELEGETVGENVTAVFTAGHTRPGLGAARYVLDADQASPTASAWRRRTADGFWFVLDEAEPSFEQFGALGQTDHLNPSVDDTAAIVGGAVAWSNLTGRAVRASGRIYNVRDTLELTYGRLKGVGSTNGGDGALATSRLLFSHLGPKPGVRTALASSKKLALIEGFDLHAASWDPVSGCTGYGLDVGARLIARDLSVQHWGKSGVFLHGDGVFGGSASDGPYHSRFESCRFVYSKEHGAVVGTGANAVTFVDCEWKWNGAPSYGVAPSAAGSWDGLYVAYDADGNPGNVYAQYWPEALAVVGGDASYNSRYGVNYEQIRDSANLNLRYAEHNKSADGYQARVGSGVMNVNIIFGTVSGGAAKVKTSDVFGTYSFSNRIMVGGENLGGGGSYPSTSYDCARTGVMLASDEAGSEVRTVASVTRTGKWRARLDGTNAEWNVGFNLSGGLSHVEEITVSTTDGVKLPPRGRAVKFLTFVPIANRGGVIAGTYLGDATAWLQAAINTGKNVDLEGVTVYAAGVTMVANQQALFSSAGPANIYKNANGPILTANGADVLLAHVVFRGVSGSYTGHNLVLNGTRPRLEFCGSLDAQGRAVYGPTADKTQICGYTYGYTTADLTTTGYDIELGNAAGATLYHQISNIYSGGVNQGGVLLVNTGSHSVTDSLIGKLTIQNAGNPAGSNGGKHSGNRILGNVSVGLPSATFANNQFGAVSLTFEAGTSGCVVDASNVFAGGFTVTNSGNGNNLIIRQTSGGGSPELTYGSAANAIAIQYEQGAYARLKNGGLCLPNNIALASRNVGNTADKSLIYMSTSAADNVFVGHGTGTGSLTLQGGSGGVGIFLAGGSGTFGTFTSAGFTPGTNNTYDLGTNALRFKNIYGAGLILTSSADVSSYKVNGTKVVGAQAVGWTAATGVANKGAYATYAGALASVGYVQVEAQAVMDGLKGASERIKALEDMLRTHGLMN